MIETYLFTIEGSGTNVRKNKLKQKYGLSRWSAIGSSNGA